MNFLRKIMLINAPFLLKAKAIEIQIYDTNR